MNGNMTISRTDPFMALMGGNLINGDTYFGGIGAAQLGFWPNGFEDGFNTVGGGMEWTSLNGANDIGFYDSGVGPGAYYSSDESGFFIATPTPVFVGIGFGWSK
jgi:hypothetical protein